MGDREAPGMPGNTVPLTRGEALIVTIGLAAALIACGVLIGLGVKLAIACWPF